MLYRFEEVGDSIDKTATESNILVYFIETYMCKVEVMKVVLINHAFIISYAALI